MVGSLVGRVWHKEQKEREEDHAYEFIETTDRDLDRIRPLSLSNSFRRLTDQEKMAA
jgi:hypothetical protein